MTDTMTFHIHCIIYGSIDKYTNNLAHARAKYTRPPFSHVRLAPIPRGLVPRRVGALIIQMLGGSWAGVAGRSPATTTTPVFSWGAFSWGATDFWRPLIQTGERLEKELLHSAFWLYAAFALTILSLQKPSKNK